jgi:potassium channel subfamily K
MLTSSISLQNMNNVFSLARPFIACTVGYGDLTPTTDTGKLIAIVFVPLAVGTMGVWLGSVANWIMDARSSRFRRHMRNQELTQRDLDIMDGNGDGHVTRAEFLEFMLVAMNKIDQSLVDELRQHFDRLDVDGTEELTRDDLVEAARKKLRSPQHQLRLAMYKHRLVA